MKKALPEKMFNDSEQPRLTTLRNWVLDNAVTEIEMSERQFWNFALLQPVAEKPGSHSWVASCACLKCLKTRKDAWGFTTKVSPAIFDLATVWKRRGVTRSIFMPGARDNVGGARLHVAIKVWVVEIMGPLRGGVM